MQWSSILFSILAGAAMSVQGVVNTRLSEKIGLYESNLLVQALAFILSLLAVWIFGRGDFRQLANTPKLYWFGGALGLVITLTVMLAVRGLGATVGISVILIAQLAVAAMIDGFGWLGAERAALHWQQWTGLALMVGGILLIKLR